MAGAAPKFGDLQQTVMNILWARDGATVHEVRSALGEDRPPAYTTVLSVLQALERKGLVAHEAVAGSRKFQYRAMLSAHDAKAQILQDVMHRLFAGSPAVLVRYMLETEGFTLQELRSIRDVLDRQEAIITGASASAGVASI